jgi:hypothetical protein
VSSLAIHPTFSWRSWRLILDWPVCHAGTGDERSAATDDCSGHPGVVFFDLLDGVANALRQARAQGIHWRIILS